MNALQLRLVLACTVLSVSGCTDPNNGHGTVMTNDVSTDTLTFEGEYRATDGKGRWMRCSDARYFPVVGAGTDSLYAAYTTQVGHVGDAVKVWLRGGWASDSSIRVVRAVHIAPAMRCEPLPTAAASGSYSVDLPGSASNKRTVRIDLFPSGRAAQYSTIGSGAEREESGSWGIDSDGRVIVTWPQRPMTFTFVLHGDSLEQMAPLPAGANVSLLRNGPPDPSRGVFGEVCKLILAQPAVQAPTNGLPDMMPYTPLVELLPADTGLQALALTVSQRYGMSTELRERRWSTIGTVQDLTDMVRMLKR